ncbi:MAG: hypothetical protein R2854_12415 [Caldilineaceae bacterium]
MTLSVIYAIVSPQYRRMVIRTTIFIIAFVLITNRLREMMQPAAKAEEAAAQTALQSTITAPPPPPDFVTHTPDWFVLAVNIVMALLIVGVAWFVWRRAASQTRSPNRNSWRRRRRLRQLKPGATLRDVVMRTWR